MMSPWYWIADALLALLLLGTLVMSIRLDRALRVVRRDRAAFEALISNLTAATAAVRGGIEALRDEADRATGQIGQRAEDADKMATDLSFLIDAAERAGGKLEQRLHAAAAAREPAGMGGVAKSLSKERRPRTVVPATPTRARAAEPAPADIAALENTAPAPAKGPNTVPALAAAPNTVSAPAAAPNTVPALAAAPNADSAPAAAPNTVSAPATAPIMRSAPVAADIGDPEPAPPPTRRPTEIRGELRELAGITTRRRAWDMPRETPDLPRAAAESAPVPPAGMIKLAG